MARDRRRELTAHVNSALLNLDKAFHIECISKGITVPGLEPDSEGYYTVSKHCASVESAYVQQAKMRRSNTDLDTKVVRVTDQEWVAEIRVRRKAQ